MIRLQHENSGYEYIARKVGLPEPELRERDTEFVATIYRRQDE